VARHDGFVWRTNMLDAVLLAVGCGFFVVVILYTLDCDRI